MTLDMLELSEDAPEASARRLENVGYDGPLSNLRQNSVTCFWDLFGRLVVGDTEEYRGCTFGGKSTPKIHI
jgi:hypothetical protein